MLFQSFLIVNGASCPLAARGSRHRTSITVTPCKPKIRMLNLKHVPILHCQTRQDSPEYRHYQIILQLRYCKLSTRKYFLVRDQAQFTIYSC
jgi:hypothetical protein